MPPVVIAVAAGAAESYMGYVAVAEATSLVPTILGGLAMAGGAMQIAGAATGNQNLAKLGSVVGAVGSVGLGVEGMMSAATPAEAGGAATETNLFANQAPSATDAASQTVEQAANPAATNAAAKAATQEAGGIGGSGSNPGDVATDTGDTATPQLTSNQIDMKATGSIYPNGASPTPATSPTSAISTTGGLNDGTNLTSNQIDAQATGSIYPNGANNTGGGMLSKAADWFKSLPPQGQAEMLKTGSGIVGGIANYVSPSPIDKAKIAAMNAQTALAQQQLEQRQALNNSITGMRYNGMTTNATPGSATIAPPGTGAPIQVAQPIGMLAAARNQIPGG